MSMTRWAKPSNGQGIISNDNWVGTQRQHKENKDEMTLYMWSVVQPGIFFWGGADDRFQYSLYFLFISMVIANTGKNICSQDIYFVCRNIS